MIRRAVVLLAALLPLASCAMSREQELRKKSDAVEAQLLGEQQRIVELPAAEPNRAPRLAHLTKLRTLLSATDIAFSTAKHSLPDDRRAIAYDVIEQAYDTIQWNIPLGPADPQREMPAAMRDGVLNLNELERR